jgi:hypothetical protein
MALNDYSSVSTSAQGPSLTQVGFGTLGILAYTTAFAERSKVYEDLDGAADDYDTTDPIYLALQVAFAQDPRPPSVKVLRMANAPVFNVKVTPIAVDSAQYTLTVVSAGKAAVTVSVTADSSATVDEICDALETALEAALFTSMGTSATSVVVGTGAKTFTTQAGLHFPVGSTVIASSALGADSMTGTVTSYSGTTLVLNVASVVGSGTDTDWTFSQSDVVVTPDGGTATYLSLTAAAGIWFAVSGWSTDRLKVEDLTPDPGVAADLAAIRQADDAWYNLSSIYDSRLIQEKISDYIETIDAECAHASADWQMYDSGSSADIQSILAAKSYKRTLVYAKRNMGTFAGVGGLAERITSDPGTGPDAGGTYHAKTIAGVSVDTWTPTEKANLRTKGYCLYMTTAGLNLTLGSETPAGDFFDYTRFNDWFRIRLQEDFVQIQANNGRIRFDRIGLALVETAAKSRLSAGIRAGGIAPEHPETGEPPKVVMPAISDVSSGDRAARRLGGGGVKVYYTYVGAIHFIESTVTVTL